MTFHFPRQSSYRQTLHLTHNRKAGKVNRRPADTRETLLTLGPLELDLIERTARREGRQIELLPREFKLLEYFMRRPEQVITRDMLLRQVWHFRFLPQTNVVDVHIGKLLKVTGSSCVFNRLIFAEMVITKSPLSLSTSFHECLILHK